MIIIDKLLALLQFFVFIFIPFDDITQGLNSNKHHAPTRFTSLKVNLHSKIWLIKQEACREETCKNIFYDNYASQAIVRTEDKICKVNLNFRRSQNVNLDSTRSTVDWETLNNYNCRKAALIKY